MEVVPIRTVDWRDLIMRMKITAQRKAVAFALAKFASSDGTNVFPSQQKIADMAGCHEASARRHIAALLKAGMLALIRRGGGRGGATNTYRLTRPADITTLPLWLDPQMNRVAADTPTVEAEHRAPARGETPVENPADTSVENPETPRTSARYSGPPDGETPSNPFGNTEQSVPKYRAPVLGDLSSTSPIPAQHPAGSSKASTSPVEAAAARATTETDDDYRAAHDYLQTHPGGYELLLKIAWKELADEGNPDAPITTAVIRAAHIAQRPPNTLSA